MKDPMHRRCWAHDYCAPCFYLVTAITEPRRPVFGRLTEEGVELSAAGRAVEAVWRRLRSFYAGIEACACVVMPDHFHGIVWVHERLRQPLGHFVRNFKVIAAREAGAALGQGTDLGTELWAEGFHDTILTHKGQLAAMHAYLLDNPRRAWAKRTHPEYFTQVRSVRVGGTLCAALGNLALATWPVRRQVQVSRSIGAEALEELRGQLLAEAEHGALLVSPCISPGEKAIARAVFEAHLPLVVFRENGFPPLYKPVGKAFDACAAGRLLQLAPWPYHRDRRAITRAQCLALNALAEEFCRFEGRGLPSTPDPSRGLPSTPDPGKGLLSTPDPGRGLPSTPDPSRGVPLMPGLVERGEKGSGDEASPLAEETGGRN